MPVNRFSKRVTLALAAISVLFLLGFVRQSGGDKEKGPEQARIQRGFEIAPVSLNLGGKDRNLVGLGSYIVNTSGCIDCHTWPNWALGGNPFLGEGVSRLLCKRPGFVFGDGVRGRGQFPFPGPAM